MTDCLAAARGAALVLVLFVSVSGAPAQSAAGEAQACGGAGGARCADGLWCDPKPGLCAENVPGTCIIVRPFCTREWRPVCGCDGRTYGNDCERKAARVGKLKDGECGKQSRARLRGQTDS